MLNHLFEHQLFLFRSPQPVYNLGIRPDLDLRSELGSQPDSELGSQPDSELGSQPDSELDLVLEPELDLGVVVQF